MKKILSVFLAVLMIAGCMAISFSASAATPVETVWVTGPKAGQLNPNPGDKILNDLSKHINWASDTNDNTLILTVTVRDKETDESVCGCTFSIEKGLIAEYASDESKEAVYESGKDYVLRVQIIGSNITSSTGVQYNAKVVRTQFTNGIIPSVRFDAFEFKSKAIYNVNVTAEPVEGGAVTGGGKYAEGASVTITAAARDGYKFVKWEQSIVGPAGQLIWAELSTNASYTITSINSDRDVRAVFEKVETTQPEEPQPENLCKWCGQVHEGFFGAIVGFFHRILAAIFGAKY